MTSSVARGGSVARALVFGLKKRQNFRIWPKNPSQFWWRPFFLEITCFWAEKALEFPILAEKSVSILVKTFFLEITCFWAEKAVEFPNLAEKSVSISRINRPKSDKPCDSDSRTMKIWVKVVCSFLTLSKKPPPPFSKSWLRACLWLWVEIAKVTFLYDDRKGNFTSHKLQMSYWQ